MRWVVFLALGAMLAASTSAAAASAVRPACSGRLASQVADANCVESTDLTTNNPATTPPDNSLPSLPVGAFTPTTDRAVISPSAPNRTPITKAVPGVQFDARISDDPTGEARILFRLPNQVERQARRCRRLGNAQRVQRRLRLERLRAAAGLRLCFAEQGCSQSL